MTTDRRRVMDERIDKIAEDVNYMRGRFDTHTAFQQQLDSRLASIQSSQGKRIARLESTRDKVWGLVIGAGLGGGSLGAFLARFLG